MVKVELGGVHLGSLCKTVKESGSALDTHQPGRGGIWDLRDFSCSI